MVQRHSTRTSIARITAVAATILSVALLPQPASADTVSSLYLHSSNATGVVEVHPKVYLVFWGSQWSDDPAGLAPVLQNFFKGLYGADDTWGQILDQYCEGLAVNTITCGSKGTHVVHPTKSPLAGVWFDNAKPEPAVASPTQLTAEVVAAAKHFGNLTPASNLNPQYIIASPHGVTPGLHPGGTTCAYHKGYGAGSLGRLEWTNLPYLPDFPSWACSIQLPNFTPAQRYTILESHEYAESVTDVGGGWRSPTGGEIGDKCENGASGDALETLTTGTFAVQGIWSNSFHGCATTAGPPIWSASATHPQARPTSTPAMTYFNGQPYAAWRNPTNNDVDYSSYNGTSWTTAANITGFWGQALTNQPPSLTVLGGVLYAAWKGDGAAGDIFTSTSTDGTTWSAQVKVTGTWGTAATSSAPALGVNRNNLVVIYKGIGTTKLYFSFLNGSSWTKAAAIPRANSPFAPAIVGTPNAKLAIFVAVWTAAAGQIDTEAFTALGWGVTQTVPKATSSAAPSVARLNARTVVVAYKGLGSSTKVFYDFMFNYYGASDGFSHQLTQPRAATELGPAIAATGDTLTMAWVPTTSAALLYSTSTRSY